MNKQIYFLLILAQMANDGLSTSTIQFFKAIYPTLSENVYLNCTEMSELACMSNVAGAKHVQALLRNGYLARRHHRAWVLSDRLLKNPDLIHLLRVANGVI